MRATLACYRPVWRPEPLGCERKVLAVLVVAEEKGAIVIVIQCLPDPVQVPFKNPLFGNVPIVSDYAARCRWCREEAL